MIDKGKPLDNSPIKKAVEESIVKRLDQKAHKDEGHHSDAEVKRQPTLVKESSWEFYDKVAGCIKHLQLKKKLKKIGK